MIVGHKFEQPTWFVLLVLALVLWSSTPAAIITAFLLSFLFALNDSPPLSLMIAFLSGALLSRGHFYIVLLPIFKLFIFDRLMEQHYEETAVVDSWNKKEAWVALTGFVLFYGGPLEFWLQLFVAMFYTTVFVSRWAYSDFLYRLPNELFSGVF